MTSGLRITLHTHREAPDYAFVLLCPLLPERDTSQTCRQMMLLNHTGSVYCRVRRFVEVPDRQEVKRCLEEKS